MVIKPNAKKLRKVTSEVIAGFAGATADALTLFEKLESQLEQYPGQLTKSCVELAKLWRNDKMLRKLEAEMIVCDKNISLLISGVGDVLEPATGIFAIGSGGAFATAAAMALIDVDGFNAEQIAGKAMKIASDICIYTNNNFTVLKL